LFITAKSKCIKRVAYARKVRKPHFLEIGGQFMEECMLQMHRAGGILGNNGARKRFRVGMEHRNS
jgi:hypothetical protein